MRNLHVRKNSLPRFYEGGRHAVLLIHGYTAFPGEMEYLGKRLHERGFSVSIPRLPGHGTDHHDFLCTDWRDWLRRCTDAFLELRTCFDTVSIVGNSMGGVLALILASRFQVYKLALSAPAVTNTKRIIIIAPLLKYFMHRIRRPYSHTYVDPDMAYLAREYWRYSWIPPAASLYKLQNIAKKSLRHVQADTLIVVSKKDRTVPASVAQMIEQRIGSERTKTVVLEESPHILVNDVEREKVADEIIAWLES